jgi:hypothetical protein
VKLFSPVAQNDDKLMKLQQKSSSLQIYVYFSIRAHPTFVPDILISQLPDQERERE